MLKKVFLSSFLTAVFLFEISYSENCDYRASNDGTGTECTDLSPCSLQTALDLAKNDGKDSVICLEEGVFSITSLQYGNHTEAAEDKNLTVIGTKNSDGEPVSVLDLSYSPSPFTVELCRFDGTNCTLTRNNATISLKNLKISNANSGALSVWLGSANLYLENVIFDNNRGNKGSGLFVFSQENSDIKIKNCVFSTDNSSSDGVVYIKAQNGNIYLESNIFDKGRSLSSYSSCGGICVEGTGAEITLVNNIVRNNTSGYKCGGGKIKTTTGTVNIINNTLINNSATYYGGLCVVASDDTASINLYNNLFWNNSSTGSGKDLYIDSDNDNNGFGCEVKVFNNSLSCPISLTPSSCFQITDTDNFSFDEISNISGDPKITADGHLKDGSPCIDAGTRHLPITLPPTDIDGESRIQGIEIDIGADESGGSPATTYRLEVVISGKGKVISNPSGIYCGSDCEEEYLSNIHITLTASASGSYKFDRWGGNCSDCGSRVLCDVRMNSDKTCYAYFTSMLSETTPDNEGCCCSFSGKVKLSESGFNILSLLIIPAFVIARRIIKRS